MKYLLLVLVILFSQDVSTQIVNGDFEKWDSVTMFGQPYITPHGWGSSNSNNISGFANISVRPDTLNGNIRAYITGSRGTDALGSGFIRKRIPTKNLKGITFSGQCDTIYRNGSCDFMVRALNNKLLLKDSILVQDKTMKLYDFTFPQEWEANYDSVDVYWVANNYVFALEPTMDRRAHYIVDDIDAFYVLSDGDDISVKFQISPNPTSGKLNIDWNGIEKPDEITVYDQLGRVVTRFSFKRQINVGELSQGRYFIALRSGKQTWRDSFVLIN